MARFERSNLSKLRSQRGATDRRIRKLTWRIVNDPLADLVGLSEQRDKLYLRSAELTKHIAAELHQAERRGLRRELLRHAT